MARVHHVKKARRALPQHGIAVGDAYYWWAHRIGRSSTKHFSKTPPKASQLTSSEFLGNAYSIGEEMDEWSFTDKTTGDELEADREDVVSRIRDLASETEDKLSNMPDSLQQGPTGELLQNRVDSCNEWADNLEQVDIPTEADDGESEEDYRERLQEAFDELQSYRYDGE